MIRITVTTLLFISIAHVSLAANYILHIGTDAHEISLDKDITIQVGQQNVSVRLEQKEILTYQTDTFSFEYPRQYAPAKSQIDDGIFQTAIMTPLGSVVIIQEYMNLDPSNIIDLMINEVTKEEREYGYTIGSSKASTTLSDGKMLKGKVVTSKYKDSDIKRFFYTYGAKDSGLLILTQIDYLTEPGAEAFINHVMTSLKITMK